MNVSEIFLSLQGEGPNAGVPTIFVRLQGCLVGCRWCDSKFAWSNGGEDLSVFKIISQVLQADQYFCRQVYLTGGEPLEQVMSLGNLVSKLQDKRYNVTIATSGTLPRPGWWNQVRWDVDYKCPSSGVDIFDLSWKTVGQKNCIKFVVADELDLKFVEGVLPQLQGPLCPTLLVSPAILPGHSFDKDEEWLQTVWQFCITHNLRYSLQIHKVVFGDRKGV